MSKQEPSFDLSSWNPLPFLQKSFKKTTQNYNVALQTQKRLMEKLKTQQQQGVIVPGIKNTFINRYEGMKGVQKLPRSAKQGLFWVSYYLFTPQIILQQHVEKATKNWAWNKLSMKNPMELISSVVSGVVTGVVTTSFTDRTDIENMTDTSKSLVQARLKTIAVSTMFGMAVSMFLKQVGKTSKSEITRQLATVTRRSWQITGVVAVLHGLGSIDDAMNDPELSAFTKSLKEDRDKARMEKWKQWQNEWRVIVPNQLQQDELLMLMSNDD